MSGFNRADDPVYPPRRNMQDARTHAHGITLREHFAGLALQGLLANCGGPFQSNGMSGWALTNCTTEDVAGVAVDMADALIARLEAGRNGS